MTFKTLLHKLRTFMFYKGKMSYSDLMGFGKKFKTQEKTLIVYIEFDYKDLLPNNDILPHYAYDTDRYYGLLADIPSNSYPNIVATGLLEHMKDPKKLIEECHRIVQPGGKVYISVSSVFSVHRGPDDYFHMTQFGAKLLFENFEWSNLDVKGSCMPFKTVGMMIQRILLQSEVRFFWRPFLELLAWCLPVFDYLVVKQFSGRQFKKENVIDSMLPSNVQVIATK